MIYSLFAYIHHRGLLHLGVRAHHLLPVCPRGYHLLSAFATALTSGAIRHNILVTGTKLCLALEWMHGKISCASDHYVIDAVIDNQRILCAIYKY
jgi:hypothetical protein